MFVGAAVDLAGADEGALRGEGECVGRARAAETIVKTRRKRLPRRDFEQHAFAAASKATKHCPAALTIDER